MNKDDTLEGEYVTDTVIKRDVLVESKFNTGITKRVPRWLEHIVS